MIRYNVYVLINPDTGKPFYVGCTKNIEQRVQAHICAGLWPWRDKKYLLINKILNKHGYILYMVLHKTKCPQKAGKLEKHYYTYYTSSGIDLLQSKHFNYTLKYANRHNK